ncbi:tetratricopeptide repeat protein [Limnoraphis robusta CCNP1324]|nr:tetratricopeptide repeat protein [Limnoraphis robusta]MEA5546439.1 tetratricopeptide repeat protein [Limnoraphis robusta CCNP1324]
MSEETNDKYLSNQSQGIGNKNVSGDDNAIASVNAMGNANINQSRIITIYNYHYQQQTVTELTEDNTEDNLICPYQGLYHFSYENSEYFFGREVFVEELFQYTETRNFIPVLGASGSGKSSVILAGLVPKLVQAGRWQFTHFRPGNDPFHALAQALVPLYEPDLDKTDGIAQARKLAAYFQDNTVPLSDVFSTIQRNHPHNRILLIADQFEELYTLCNDEKIRRQFLDTLLTTFKSFAEQSSLSTVLVGTMRADFLGNALSYRPLADVLQKGNIMLGPMNEKELRDIIEKPAKKLGVSFESGLVERILDDVDKQPGNLPLLEFALTELWKERKGKQLTHKAYENIGEVSGALTRYADDKFSKLNEQEKEQVRRIFVQLVRPGAGTEDTRRVATKAELNDSNWDLVKKLADSRLVVTSRTVITREITDHSQPQPDNIKEQETVEVVHEALIRNWGQLRQWMETDREFRTWQERLRASMGYWQEKNRDNGLLLRGAALSQAEEQLEKRGDELSPDEREFIEKSRQYKQRKRQRNICFLTASFVAISGVAAVAVWQWNQAVIGKNNANFRAEIVTLESRFNSSLSVQMKAIEIGRKLQRAKTATTDIQIQGADLLRQIVDWSGHKEINSLEGHENTVIGVAFSPNGDMIASASWDNTVKLWKPDGTLVKTLEGHENSVIGVAFSPNGDMIASGSVDKTVKLWKPDGTLVKTFVGHESYVYGVAFSPNGEMIASASDDNTVKLWKPDGTLVKTLEGHGGSVWGVAFSPNGDMIASGSFDKKVLLWKPDGTLVKTLEGHENTVYGVAFSPKGDMIASASGDKTVKLWNFNRDELLAHACNWMSDYLKNNPNFEEEPQICGEVEPSATAWFLLGEHKAAQGKIDEAVSKFQQAVKLDPKYSLDWAAASLVRIGKQFIGVDESGQPILKFEEAILAFNQAQKFDSKLEIQASDWNKLCWEGSVNKQAEKVMFACENAVQLAPENGWIYNSRGLARALTGDVDGAIEDFETFVQLAGNEEEKAQRNGWIESLKKNENPFTDEVLQKWR